MDERKMRRAIIDAEPHQVKKRMSIEPHLDAVDGGHDVEGPGRTVGAPNDVSEPVAS